MTGAGAFLLGKRGGKVRIPEVTPGKIVDYGVKDSLNMGACMAPAAADTIEQNLKDLKRKPEDYDRTITGDLGYGKKTFWNFGRKGNRDQGTAYGLWH